MAASDVTLKELTQSCLCIAHSLVDEHECIRQARVIGLFGCADLVDTKGENAGNRFTNLQGGGHEKVLAFKRAMLDEGIISLFRNWCVQLLRALQRLRHDVASTRSSLILPSACCTLFVWRCLCGLSIAACCMLHRH